MPDRHPLRHDSSSSGERCAWNIARAASAARGTGGRRADGRPAARAVLFGTLPVTRRAATPSARRTRPPRAGRPDRAARVRRRVTRPTARPPTARSGTAGTCDSANPYMLFDVRPRRVIRRGGPRWLAKPHPPTRSHPPDLGIRSGHGNPRHLARRAGRQSVRDGDRTSSGLAIMSLRGHVRVGDAPRVGSTGVPAPSGLLRTVWTGRRGQVRIGRLVADHRPAHQANGK